MNKREIKCIEKQKDLISRINKAFENKQQIADKLKRESENFRSEF